MMSARSAYSYPYDPPVRVSTFASRPFWMAGNSARARANAAVSAQSGDSPTFNVIGSCSLIVICSPWLCQLRRSAAGRARAPHGTPPVRARPRVARGVARPHLARDERPGPLRVPLQAVEVGRDLRVRPRRDPDLRGG